MERLFDDLFTTRRPGRALAPALWEPAVELFETEGDVVFRAEMPGIDPKQVGVTVTEDTLTVKGEARTEQEEKGRNTYRRGKGSGALVRAIPLPCGGRGQPAA